MPRAGPSISIPTKLLATGVACALAVVVCGTAATVVVASDVTNKLGRPARAELLFGAYRAGSAAGTPFRDIGATALALDSLVAPLGPAVPVDLSVRRHLAAFNGDSLNSWGWDPASVADRPGPLPDTAAGRPLLPLTLDSLRKLDLPGLRSEANDPWLPLFREWARGPRQPALWAYRSDFSDIADVRALRARSMGPWRVMFSENETASLLALHDGSTTIALQRARENVAAARNFLEQPVLIDALRGREFLRRSLQVLAFVAASAGDSTTANRARNLDLAAQRFVAPFNLKLLVEQESDANSHATEDFAANRANHPSLRVESLSTIALGGCRNLPELVFGFSVKRRDAMARAVANIQDIERGAELGALYQKFLEYVLGLRELPETELPRTLLGRSVLLSTFSWIVPPGVRARTALCMEQGL